MEKFRGASALGSQTTAAPAAPLTDFDAVNEALSLARDIANRVESLADRLCGCVPQTAPNGISEAPDGVLPRLGSEARGTCSRLRDGHAALERIESALP